MIANDAIGNFVVATPLLQMLRSLEPSEIHYYGGTRTLEMQAASDLFEWHFPLHGSAPAESARTILRHVEARPYDLVVNLERTTLSRAAAAIASTSETSVVGPALGPAGRDDLPSGADDRSRLLDDQHWIDPQLAARYPFLRSGFIGEIFARLAYLEGPVPAYRVPSTEPPGVVPDVLIATTASLPEKLWDPAKWRVVLERCRAQGVSVGVLGAKPKVQGEFWKGADLEAELVAEGLAQDLRGAYTLPEVVGALGRCRAALTLDNGILHLGVAAGAKVVGLYRHGIHRLWAPPAEGLAVLTPGESGSVPEISETVVWEALARAL